MMYCSGGSLEKGAKQVDEVEPEVPRWAVMYSASEVLGLQYLDA